MSVEQTTQLIQLILNSVLVSVACAVVLSGLIARHAAVGQQIQALYQLDQELLVNGGQSGLSRSPYRSHGSYLRGHIRCLRHRYQMARYSVVAAYYALIFCLLSCFILVLRGMIDWNGLIQMALGLFVIGVATLLAALGLTLFDWHLSDRAVLEEIQTFLSLGNGHLSSQEQQKSRLGKSASRPTPLRHNRSKMRVG